MKYRAFNESRAAYDGVRAGGITGAVKLIRRYGLLMNAMDLRREPHGTINENIKSVQLLPLPFPLSRSLDGRSAPYNYRYRTCAYCGANRFGPTVATFD